MEMKIIGSKTTNFAFMEEKNTVNDRIIRIREPVKQNSHKTRIENFFKFINQITTRRNLLRKPNAQISI